MRSSRPPEGAASKIIDIAEFVPLSQVDPVYFEKAYCLGPDKGGEKAYRLLAEAMATTDRSRAGRAQTRRSSSVSSVTRATI